MCELVIEKVYPSNKTLKYERLRNDIFFRNKRLNYLSEIMIGKTNELYIYLYIPIHLT